MVSITYERSSLVLKMRYDSRCVSQIKQRIPSYGRRWDPDSRCWYLSPVYFDCLIGILKGRFSSSDIYVDSNVPRLSKIDDAMGKKYSPYNELFLLPNAPREVVQAAYRALAKLHHPDFGGDVEKMKRLNIAFEKIKS